MGTSIRAFLLRLGRERVTKALCIVATVAAFIHEYRQFDNPALHDLVAPLALAIVVPILYLTPLVWLVYRYLVRPNHENR
ncbi:MULTISPECIES: hypothetical protein [Pseudomonadota]|jgi:hypothetical protein|uniref:hypothetical protein n=1 Tax=Pseudomonadota TaxID=1224 RepID=UPI0004599126|nr:MULTISPECIES: hypothetical protein [Pseudomonadota]ALY57643.1 hypothetical protein HW06_00855 [Pseudomonas aeruginosa]KCB49407.1 hypothetical protein L538_3556 [Bordetella hinzii 4161]MCS7785567.1 hypothetical protein [Pseudomonas aeruginosa]HEJ4885926.1 hypothetical protein [Pseudomonas aeruginosa]HEJ5490046.1 hypothetical protein [Pseudomonas aeruginosa]